VHGQLGRERAIVETEPAACNTVPARTEPLPEMGDRPRPERDVDGGIQVEDALALSGCSRLRAAASPRYAASFVSGFSRIVHVLRTTTSASSALGASPSPSSSSSPLIRSLSWTFI
jgi:hypothetical protein